MYERVQSHGATSARLRVVGTSGKGGKPWESGQSGSALELRQSCGFFPGTVPPPVVAPNGVHRAGGWDSRFSGISLARRSYPLCSREQARVKLAMLILPKERITSWRYRAQKP